MTLSPAGSHLAPVDLPPPPPAADPREPTQTLTPRQRGSRTPQRSRSPLTSREVSPVRSTSVQRGQSDALGSPPLYHPVPRPSAGSNPPSGSIPIHGHHLSRPSSPSSIHSSGSAIFERDIEYPAVATLSLNPNPSQGHTLNHKSSRLSHLSHGSALDHTVPAVLDDAVEALTAGDGMSRGFDGLEIEAPASSSGVGMARQSSSSLPVMTGRRVSGGPAMALHSRSPSPISVASRTSSVASPAQSPPILSQLSGQQVMQATGAAGGSAIPSMGDAGAPAGTTRPAMPQRMSTGPQVPGGWAFGGASQAPKTDAIEEIGSTSPPPEETPASPIASPGINTTGAGPSATPPAAIPSHLSPNKNKHRISYLSANDLLLSVPTQVTSLEDITSGHLSPDHLPGTVSPSMPTHSPVIGSPVRSVSGAASSPAVPGLTGMSGSMPAQTPPPSGLGAGPGQKALHPRSSWDANMSASSGQSRLGGLGLGEGEWQREGLGKGLEQRLEEVAQTQGS
ncbi:hypothetical protein IAU60_002798 [Kwoniella sp. DSM 27419]